jgi:hypothetical protein
MRVKQHKLELDSSTAVEMLVDLSFLKLNPDGTAYEMRQKVQEPAIFFSDPNVVDSKECFEIALDALPQMLHTKSSRNLTKYEALLPHVLRGFGHAEKRKRSGKLERWPIFVVEYQLFLRAGDVERKRTVDQTGTQIRKIIAWDKAS